MGRITQLGSIVMVLIFLSACVTPTEHMDQVPQISYTGVTPTAIAPDQGFAVPWPDEFAATSLAAPRGISGLETVEQVGDEYWHCSENATVFGVDLALSAPVDQVCWGMYRFTDLADEDQALSITLNLSMLEPVEYFIGFADFTRDRWHWLAAADKQASVVTEDTFLVPSVIDAISNAGSLYVVFLVHNDVSSELASISLHVDVNTGAPVANLRAAPSHGNVPYSVSLIASDSIDRGGGGIVNYEWDFDGDGTYDQSGSDDAVSNPYYDIGEIYPVVRVTDTGGLTDTASCKVYASGWLHTWGTGSNENFNCVARGPGGTMYFAGSHDKSVSGADVLLACCSAYGELLWLKSWDFGGTDLIYGGTTDSAGNLYLVGESSNSSESWIGVLLLKINPAGELVYSRSWHKSPYTSRGNAITIVDDQFLYVVGTASDFGLAGNDLLMMLFLADGSLVGCRVWGGAGSDVGNDITATDSGDLWITGSYDSFSTDPDVLVIKAGPLLNPYWAKVWNSRYDFGTGICLDWVGNAHLTGYTGPLDSPDLLILKIDDAGALVYQRRWSAGEFNIGHDILVTGNMMVPNRIFICGEANGPSGTPNGLLLELDSQGYIERQFALWTADNSCLLGLALGPGGAFLLSGNANLAAGLWADTTGTIANCLGSLDAATGSSKVLYTEAIDIDGILTSPALTVDTGGGKLDLLAGGCFIDDL